jgi:hypothetical protein
MGKQSWYSWMGIAICDETGGGMYGSVRELKITIFTVGDGVRLSWYLSGKVFSVGHAEGHP